MTFKYIFLETISGKKKWFFYFASIDYFLFVESYRDFSSDFIWCRKKKWDSDLKVTNCRLFSFSIILSSTLSVPKLDPVEGWNVLYNKET